MGRPGAHRQQHAGDVSQRRYGGHRQRVGLQRGGERDDGLRRHLDARIEQQDELRLGRLHADIARPGAPEVARHALHMDAFELGVNLAATVLAAGVNHLDLHLVARMRVFQRLERETKRVNAVPADEDHRDQRRRRSRV